MTREKGPISGLEKFGVLVRSFPGVIIEGIQREISRRSRVGMINREIDLAYRQSVERTSNATTEEERLKISADLRERIDNIYMEHFIVGKPKSQQDEVKRGLIEQGEKAQRLYSAKRDDQSRSDMEFSARMVTKITQYQKSKEGQHRRAEQLLEGIIAQVLEDRE